jgi:glutathione S-transferase
MIELYHHGSSVCAAKVRLVFAEKGAEWQGHYVDILTGDQFAPAYLKLNPKAVVPTLVHDGDVILESTVICEYLDEVLPEPPLKPSNAVHRAEMRLWTKAVDEDMHPACAEITFASCHRHIVNRLGQDGVRRFLESTPPQSVTPTWHERKKQIVTMGFEAPGIERKIMLYDGYLQKMDDALARAPWLVGDSLSLADIAMAPYVNRLDMLGMSEMWTRSRPRLTDWLARFKARPSFQSSLLTWCPPDLTDDLRTFGRQSWPQVERMLERGGAPNGRLAANADTA